MTLLWIAFAAFSQPASQVYSSPGTYTFTIPSGYTVNLLVKAWGAGGGGTDSNEAGGGGGGGGYSSNSYSSIGQGEYTIVVGAGGEPGSNGGNSSYNFVGLVVSSGGSPGTSFGTGGNGGAGSTKNGGAGGDRSHKFGAGGGGGGSGSNATAGQDATGGKNGTGGAGGTPGGGHGGDPNSSGLSGTIGGGGGGKGDGNNPVTSGTGGNGRVEVTVLLALPVELVSFQASAELPNIHLKWQTATEINSDYYAVEHSRDGQEWAQLALIPAAGESVNVSDYGYTHVRPSSGVQYYRLRMVDLDGSYEYSPTIAAQVNREQETIVKAWNTNGQYFMDGIANPEGGKLSLFDIQGQLLASAPVLPGIQTPSLIYPKDVSGIRIMVWQPAYGPPIAIKLC
ncbi:MAG: hypothetical protein K9I85_05390 [Saprospiraceae bacterium]|nr:hypothetical protein [Saprospiraceae bacterium]